MAQATIVAVPGAWHSPEIYDATLALLREKGYPTVPLALPSVGAHPPHSSYQKDVDAIRNTLTQLIDQGKDVVLALHSYAGVPGTDASEGLGKKERESNGLKGGIIRIVYVMAFAQLGSLHGDGNSFPEWVTPDFKKGIAVVTAEDARKAFYNDLSDAEAGLWAAKLKHQSLGVYTSACVYPAWCHIPCTYVKAMQDGCGLLPDVVDMWLSEARKLDANAFDVVEEYAGGHCFMIGKPESLAEALEHAAAGGHEKE